MRKKASQPCPSCGYLSGPDHERWCPALHPQDWSWLLRARSGPGMRHQFYEGTEPDLEEVTHLFRIWISYEKDFAATETGTFRLEVFHLFRGRAMKHSAYTVSFANGKRELWGNAQAQREIQQAWERAGGTYRETR